MPMQRCQQGTVFYEPGDPGDKLFILKEGTVTLFRLTPEGRKLTVDSVSAGTIFGEMALAGQSMRDCFAEARDDSLVCTMSRPDVERLLREQPRVALRLLPVMGRRIQELEERLEQMAYGSVRQRLVRFLIAQARPARDGCEVKSFSHEEIGEAVGAIRQTVTVELRRLEEEGLLELGRRRVKLLDIRAINSTAY